MIRVARLLVARQRTVCKHLMLGVVQHEFVFRRTLQHGINRQAGFHIRVTDRRDVLCACH